MKVLFVLGALVRDGAWWWSRMVEQLKQHGLDSAAVELASRDGKRVDGHTRTRPSLGSWTSMRDTARDRELKAVAGSSDSERLRSAWNQRCACPRKRNDTPSRRPRACRRTELDPGLRIIGNVLDVRMVTLLAEQPSCHRRARYGWRADLYPRYDSGVNTLLV